MTGREAHKAARKKVTLLRRLSDELTAIMDELALPTPEEFEAMRRGEIAWSEEAHIAAVIRNANFYTEEAATVLADYGGQTSASLDRLWKKDGRPGFPLERSLRYLVQERSGVEIPPSSGETHYFDPSAQTRAVTRTFIELLGKTCDRLQHRVAAADEEAAAEAVESER